MAADKRDVFLQQHTPVVMVPRFGELEPLQRVGHRFLAASDGLWLELRRKWLYLREPIAESAIAMPYGEVERVAEYQFDELALAKLIARFRVDARAAMPNECAGWGVWSESSGALEYWPLITIAASPGSVEFHRPTLEDGLHLAVDLHSHGALPAFFSGTDDDDDAGEVKLSVVLGQLHGTYEVALRLCALGLFVEDAGE